jgi:hypothetical protein
LSSLLSLSLLSLSLALSLAATSSDVGITKEDYDDKDVGQDDKESLHAPALPTELMSHTLWQPHKGEGDFQMEDMVKTDKVSTDNGETLPHSPIPV